MHYVSLGCSHTPLHVCVMHSVRSGLVLLIVRFTLIPVLSRVIVQLGISPSHFHYHSLDNFWIGNGEFMQAYSRPCVT